MLVKLVLITTICSFVYVRSIEPSVDGQHLPSFDESRFDTNMDAESTKTERHVFHIHTTPKNADDTVLRPAESRMIVDHESTHMESKHPKKRTMDTKEDRLTNLQPGCCG